MKYQQSQLQVQFPQGGFKQQEAHTTKDSNTFGYTTSKASFSNNQGNRNWANNIWG